MKAIFIIFLLTVSFALAQSLNTDEKFVLPKAEDIQQIDTTNNEFRYETPAHLLRNWPNLIAKTPEITKPSGNAKPDNYQFGTVTLKDGTIWKWRSSHFGNVTIYNESVEQFYIVDISVWTYFLGQAVYTIIFFLLFAVVLGLYVAKRRRPANVYMNQPSRFGRDYWAFLLVRLGAFILFGFLAYLLLQIPLQHLSDGVVEIHPRGGPSILVFAETSPGSFRFGIFLDSIFTILSIICSLIFLLINPQGKFWRKKTKTVS